MEVSTLYRRDPEGLTVTATHATAAGQVLGLADDVIHAVTAQGPEPSEALHVYVGPRTDVERDLFDGSRARRCRSPWTASVRCSGRVSNAFL